MMRRSVVVVLALIIVGAEAVVAIYCLDNRDHPDDRGTPERPELRSAGKVILTASDLGADWHVSTPPPMNLTGFSYTDLAMAGFGRTFNGSGQSFTLAVMIYPHSYDADQDLRIVDDRTYELWPAENGTRQGVDDGRILYGPGTSFYFGPAGNTTNGFYYSPDNSSIDIFVQRGNVLVFVQCTGMDPQLAVDITEMQCDRVHFVGAILPPGTLT